VYSTDWITTNDLTLTFDGQGRLWHFRPTKTYGHPVQARLVGTDLVVTVVAPGVRPGDLDVQLEDAVLQIMDSAGERPTATRVGLPGRAELHTLQTAYGDGTFEVRVPLAPVTVLTPEPEAVPVAC
jgi:HSP20 family molecular chaperone IbpA